MSDSNNVQLIQDAYRAFQEGRIDAVLAALSDDVTWETSGPEELPYSGKRTGRNEVAEFFKLLGESEEIELFEPRRFFADGDTVVVLGNYRSRFRASGQVIAFDWVQVFTILGGKVTSFREYFDSARIAKLLNAGAGARVG